MMVVDIEVWPGGWADNKRCIQRIVLWNVSDLADVSNYEYAVSRPYGRDLIGQPPSGRWLADNRLDPQVAFHGAIEGHHRSAGALVLVARVLQQIHTP